MFQFVVNSFLVVLASLAQTAGFMALNGIKPNLALALIVSISVYETKWLKRIIFILLAALFLKSGPYIDFQIVIFAGITALGIALIDYLPWHRQINWFFALSAATLAGVALGTGWFELGIELVYNLAVGLVFLLIVPRIDSDGENTRAQKNKFG